ncbi:hypothetical protein LX15_001533 [Streptoalloteichus tenebrarius]|uniref:SWIM-type domain-containing protein n=1 Tax=Streptoalloteichus tenebrarius (strain ATCC 17920 / DSM 40477 / JCM 4838 / CBS 697.72 / NBRC 16177 / NCIMB 11028 / NRRL B-12390 / A12253. 1 / ISP 5477) TaxID=1933 RepID=A0ABT1HQQ3_STRSD|nr:hypothetical protein [Streptoalloteichus tenebrarius]MCP2257847.1 hypothetical protein [Streptoalloteichus tenebrarius]
MSRQSHVTRSRLNRRHLALLRAVADGRAEVTCSCAPDLRVDGFWCDHTAANDLVRSGLIRPVRSAPVGQLVPAEITAPGREALAEG